MDGISELVFLISFNSHHQNVVLFFPIFSFMLLKFRVGYHHKQVFRKGTQLCSNFIDNQFTPVCSSFSTLSTCIQLISCERYSRSTFHHDLSNKCQVRKTNETFRRGGRILEVALSISGKGGLKLA